MQFDELQFLWNNYVEDVRISFRLRKEAHYPIPDHILIIMWADDEIRKLRLQRDKYRQSEKSKGD